MVQLLARLLWRLLGWQIEGPRPSAEKYIAVGEPHTSNWDGIHAIFTGLVLDMRLRFVGKDSLFRFPLGVLLRALGGIPVDRSAPGNFVERAAAIFTEHERMVLAITPSGTRGKSPYWKSGFYHIARAAQVPIVLFAVNYKRKRVIVGPTVFPGDDIEADMDILRAFYAEHGDPKHPGGEGPVVLKEEIDDLPGNS